jgi:N-acetylmuramoyl-L-alanine amidase
VVAQSLTNIFRAGSRAWLSQALLLLALACGASSAGAAGIGSVGFVPAGKGGELVVTLDGAADRVAVMTLGSPERLVLDIDGARLGGRIGDGAGAITRIRAGQFSTDTVRIVLDLDLPLLVAGHMVSPDGRRISLKLEPGSAAAFVGAVRAGRRVIRAAPAAAVPPPAATPQPTARPAPAPAPTREPAAVAAKPPQVSPDVRGKRPLVVIDAGHGGHDTGAISVYENRREKDVTLAIARAIVNEINASGRVRAALTRNDDRFLVLHERVQVARRQGADLFISVHADSAPNPEASGATVYTLSEVASDREAARLAAKENKADIVNGVDLGKEANDVSSILIDLAQRETMNVSSAFAALLQRELAPHVKFRSSFHRFAGFAVLKAADTPAVLLETGYLTHGDDARFLFSKNGQQAFALGVRKAVEAHFARRQIGR